MPRARKPQTDDLVSPQYGTTADLLRTERQVPDQQQPFIRPDEVPNLSAPSSRPNEPVTTGLPIGPGAGPEIMQPITPDPVRKTLQAMVLRNPENHTAMRLLDLLDSMGR